ncbi:hypothetical protein CDAR_85081 [Caerostris darwini]|uniref:Uncharacterized protein n=1 Tax=Caerostris darwini TaxID=1538125 RepID=A0AAV4N0S1_9ARAC|nr:hypothetical protein CDAR_85081 [Caerostris darwini]
MKAVVKILYGEQQICSNSHISLLGYHKSEKQNKKTVALSTANPFTFDTPSNIYCSWLFSILRNACKRFMRLLSELFRIVKLDVSGFFQRHLSSQFWTTSIHFYLHCRIRPTLPSPPDDELYAKSKDLRSTHHINELSRD